MAVYLTINNMNYENGQIIKRIIESLKKVTNYDGASELAKYNEPELRSYLMGIISDLEQSLDQE